MELCSIYLTYFNDYNSIYLIYFMEFNSIYLTYFMEFAILETWTMFPGILTICGIS
jgi:hypothetical protein